jgi:hypothetical protein
LHFDIRPPLHGWQLRFLPEDLSRFTLNPVYGTGDKQEYGSDKARSIAVQGWLEHPASSFTWSPRGVITKRWRIPRTAPGWRPAFDFRRKEDEEMEAVYAAIDGLSADALKKAARDSHDYRDSPGTSHPWDFDGREGIPFDDTTMYYENISTELGRRQMSTFPKLRALCNALQLAGYRADIDAEGDIWFEDEDGDAYFDAREHQPGPEEDDSVVANCPICRNPEKYGLGYILKRAEAGLRYMEEFRKARKGKEASQRFWDGSFCWFLLLCWEASYYCG